MPRCLSLPRPWYRSNLVHLDNVPRIRDIETLVELIRSVGTSVEWVGQNALDIHAKDLAPSRSQSHAMRQDPRFDPARRRRSSPVAGRLPCRHRVATSSAAVGYDTHFLALEQLGAKFTHGKMIEMRVNGFKGADVFLDEPSVTATENALVAASAATGTTILRNAASEPHVQDLAHFLIALGAEIEGVGTNTMTIHGSKSIGSKRVTLYHRPRPHRGWVVHRNWQPLRSPSCESIERRD